MCWSGPQTLTVTESRACCHDHFTEFEKQQFYGLVLTPTQNRASILEPARHYWPSFGAASTVVAAAPVAAGLVQWLATSLAGMPIGDPVMMWLFSSASIAAIGIGTLSVFAIFGSGIGSLVNTLFFIALSMSSSGGTVPLAATPPFYQWLSTFELFLPIIEGVRSILYFDGGASAGLSDGWLRIALGDAIGVAVGLAATTLYGRHSKFSRHPPPAASGIRAS